MNKNITTLAELEEEQEKLKMMMEVTRQEFSRNIGTNRKELKNYLIKNVALPVGAVGLGAAAVNKLSSNKQNDNLNENQNNNTSTITNIGFLKMLIPVGISLFQTYLLKEQNQDIEEIATDDNNVTNSSSKLRTVA